GNPRTANTSKYAFPVLFDGVIVKRTYRLCPTYPNFLVVLSLANVKLAPANVPNKRSEETAAASESAESLPSEMVTAKVASASDNVPTFIKNSRASNVNVSIIFDTTGVLPV